MLERVWVAAAVAVQGAIALTLAGALVPAIAVLTIQEHLAALIVAAKRHPF